MTNEKIPDNEKRYANQLIDMLRKKMTEDNPDLMCRDAHSKQHGLVKATLTVAPDLPVALQQGIFKAAASYKAWVRFSNASGQSQNDYKKDIRGVAIKLLDVAGEKLDFGDGNKTSQDFMFVSTPVFIARDVKDFASLVKGLVGNKLWLLLFLATHLRSLLNIVKSQICIYSPLEARYWSTTPYQFGHAGVVKYSLIPQAPATPLPKGLGVDFLRNNMREQLAVKSYAFDFALQLQTDAKAMPIEDACKNWPESISPFIVVATLTIDAQVFDLPEQNKFGRILSFNPWHALVAHKPLGGINRARSHIYPVLSKYRHDVNNDICIEPIDYTIPPI